MRNELVATKKMRGGGPRTAEGKARSSRNSFKHGRYAADLIEVLRISKCLLHDFQNALQDERRPSTNR
jgi:hypothetical protein